MSTSSAEKLFALLGGERREAGDLGVSLAQLSSPGLGPKSTSYVKIQPSPGLKCNHSHAAPFQEAAASLPSSTSPRAEVKPMGSWRRPDSGLRCLFREGRGQQVSAGRQSNGRKWPVAMGRGTRSPQPVCLQL